MSAFDENNAVFKLTNAQAPKGGYPYCREVNDPGPGGAIAPNRSGECVMKSAASLTAPSAARTLAAPIAFGLNLVLDVSALGTAGPNGYVTVVVANAFDGTHTTITFEAVGAYVKLFSVRSGLTTFKWALDAIAGTGVSLS